MRISQMDLKIHTIAQDHGIYSYTICTPLVYGQLFLFTSAHRLTLSRLGEGRGFGKRVSISQSSRLSTLDQSLDRV